MRRSTYEAAERRMWRDAFCAVFATYSVQKSADQADLALEAFRDRYPAPEPEPDEHEEAPSWRAVKTIRTLVGALVELRAAVKAEPAMNNARFDSLGIGVNGAIDEGLDFMADYPNNGTVQSPENQQAPNPGAPGGQDV